jgi:serine/threonine protein kinase
MDDDTRQQRIDKVFLEACELPPDDLPEFLEHACGSDPEMLAAVRDLLQANKKLESHDGSLPDPPLKEMLKELHDVADDPEPADIVECEQCGADLVSSPAGNTSICARCGGLTRTMKLGDEDASNQEEKLPKRFEVEIAIGEGSFGTVYKAWDSRLERDVALKLPKSKRVSRKLFVREARAASRLRHGNIVRIHDVNDADDFAFIVSDFIDGTSLNRWRKNHSLSIRQACELCIKISLAMDYAHQRGVIHRDLKPSNIVMDSAGEPNVLDFGLSKSLSSSDASLVRSGTPIGTPAFMSPEQAVGDTDKIGPASDVYALGVILYQLLTATLPFSGEDILDAICNDKPPSLLTFNTKISPALNAIVMKALAKDPRDRYATAKEFANDLQRYLNGRRVQAYPKIDARFALATARRWSMVSILILLAALLIWAGNWGLQEYRKNNPLRKVILETSLPNAELRWLLYDPITGRLDEGNPRISKSGEIVELRPGFYKILVSVEGRHLEVFRTVPDEKDTMFQFVGVPLPHRTWEEEGSLIRLPIIEIVDPQPTEDAIPIPGGTLNLGNDLNVAPMFRNREVEIASFWITKFELSIDDVRNEFPTMTAKQLNFEIIAAYAEKVGAAIPTIEEYFYLDQQGIELPNLTTGLIEWTESPLPEATVDGGPESFTIAGDLDKRMVLQSEAALKEVNVAFKSVIHANFASPISSQSSERNSGFRLIWRLFNELSRKANDE